MNMDMNGDMNMDMNHQMEQSALVAEMSLSKSMNECLLRSYCLVGAHPTRTGQLAEVNKH